MTTAQPECPACGARAGPEARFCSACGTSLATGAPPLRFASPLAYTPPHLVERIFKYRSALQGERKLVTVLFCDLVRSTALAERLGPEGMHAVLDRFFATAFAEVHRLEGTVNQLLGDGFMALFGAPLALEQHERQAVLAALAIRRSVAERMRDSDVALVLRMGLNTGHVVVGRIGDNLRMDYTAVGDTTHVAARLQEMAGPSEILLAQPTWEQVRDLVVTEPLGAVPIRGRSEPVTVHRLIARHAARSVAAAAVDEPESAPFVDREREMAALEQMLGHAERGQGRAVCVVGEPGLGKSRLLREFRRRIAGRRVTWLEGRGVSYGAGIPYLPILDILRANCGIEDADTPETAAVKIRGALLEVGLDAPERAPYLLHLLGLKEAEAALPGLSPQSIKERTFETMLQLGVSGSRRRPLVLVVENIHWIDQASEEMVARLAGALADAAILLVVTSRTGTLPAWAQEPRSTPLVLHPLGEGDSRTIVRAVLRKEDLPEATLSTIVARGEGNPFFLEELARDSAARGPAFDAHAIPGTLQGLIMARIDRLPDEAKRLLQLGSVVGREFSPRLLALAGGGSDLDPWLRELARLEFLDDRVRGEETVYAFRHALARDVVYRSLLETQQRVDHAAVGHALEDLYAGRIDEVAELLAHHFARSTEDEKAADYAARAAEKAQRRWANAEALAFWRTVEDRVGAMADTEVNRRRRIDAVLGQSEARFALGQHTEQIQALEGIRALVETAADPPRRAAWHYWQGFLHSLTGSRSEVAIEHCRVASAIAAAAGISELGAFADTCLAQALLMTGDLDGALAMGERALAIFEARDNRWWACRALAQLSPSANARGEWERGLGYCGRALAHGRAVDDLRLKVSALVRTASTHIQRGAWEAGLAWCDEALALNPIPFDAAAVRAIRGYGLVKGGKPGDGVVELEAVLTWYERSHLRYTRSLFALWLAEGHLRLGARGPARAVAEDVLAVSRDLGYRHLEGVAARVLGEALAASDPPAAAAHLDEAARLLEEVGARNEHAKVLAARGELRQRCGDPTGARDLFARALAVFEALGTVDERARMRKVLDRSPRGDGGR